jgi:hypothetical protein
MADWTTLPNTAVGVGGLPSGTTVTALRDNPVAIVHGAPNAPRPLTIEGWFQAGNQFSGLAAGSSALPTEAFSTFFSTATTNSTSYVSAGAATITSRATGTLRFDIVRTVSTGQPVGQVELRKNSTAIFTSNVGNGGVTVDAAADIGDVFELFVRRQGGTTSDNVTTACTVRANDTVSRFGILSKNSEIV